MGSNRRRRKRNVHRRNGRRRNVPAMRPVTAAAAVVFIAAAVFVIRTFYFYITGNDVTESEPYPVRGVDVSSYQLEIDWEGLEDEGYKFAFIKATEGSSLVDDRFEYNWDEANDTSIRAGAYHFLSYDSSGKSQAENYIETVDKRWGCCRLWWMWNFTAAMRRSIRQTRSCGVYWIRFLRNWKNTTE